MDNLIVNPYEQFLDLENHLHTTGTKVIPTFSENLNKQFVDGGIELGNVVLVGAKYGVGKTFFILNWILYLIRNKYKTVFFSLDMDFQKVFIRMLRPLLQMGKNDSLLTWKANKEFVREKLTSSGYYDYLRIYTNEKKVISFREITYVCEHEKPDVVFVDHLDKVYGSGQNIFHETKQISEYFRQSKQKLNTIFIVLMQLKKGDSHKRAPNALPPHKDEYKGAGNLGEDADVMLSLARPDLDQECPIDKKHIMVGALRKNRLNDESDLGYLFWRYDPVTTLLTDVGGKW